MPDGFIKKIVGERFPQLKMEQTPKDEKIQRHAERKLKI
jgi:hypothetical protein